MLQIITDKLPSTLSTTLWCVLSNAKQSGNTYVLYKDKGGSVVNSTFCLDAKHEFNSWLGLTTMLVECILIETASQDVQTMYKDVMKLNEIINNKDKDK